MIVLDRRLFVGVDEMEELRVMLTVRSSSSSSRQAQLLARNHAQAGLGGSLTAGMALRRLRA